MIKYRYIPFTHGKPRYRRIDTPQAPVQAQWQLKAQSLPNTTTTNTEDVATPPTTATISNAAIIPGPTEASAKVHPSIGAATSIQIL